MSRSRILIKFFQWQSECVMTTSLLMFSYPWHARVVLLLVLCVLLFYINKERRKNQNHVPRLWHTHHSVCSLLFFLFNRTKPTRCYWRNGEKKWWWWWWWCGRHAEDCKEKERTCILHLRLFDFSSSSSSPSSSRLLLVCVIWKKESPSWVGWLPTVWLLCRCHCCCLLLLLPATLLHPCVYIRKKERKKRRTSTSSEADDTGK